MLVADLAQAIAPGSSMHEVGIRPGEKLHEEMIAPDDSRRTVRLDDRYVVMPYVGGWGYTPPGAGEAVSDGWAFRSDTNDQWLDADSIRELIDELG